MASAKVSQYNSGSKSHHGSRNGRHGLTPKGRNPLKVILRTPRKILNGVQVIALVQSETNRNQRHLVLKIDGKFHGRRRRLFTCDCLDHFYRREGRLRSCKHTRRVQQVLRQKAGR